MARPEVCGVGLDAATRCAHYHSPLDVIAIKMACCCVYYACKDCHDALAGHAVEVWPRKDWDTHAVLCGVCAHEMTIQEYMSSGNICPRCEAAFNPGCERHYHLYFEADEF